MSNLLIDREGLSKALEDALALDAGVIRIRKLIRDIMIGDDCDIPEADEAVVMGIIHSLDGAEGEARLRSLARSYVGLLRQPVSSAQAVLLIPLIERRERLSELLGKLSSGIISRESVDSFVGEQRWSGELKHAISGLSNLSLIELGHVLAHEDYKVATSMLFGTN